MKRRIDWAESNVLVFVLILFPLLNGSFLSAEKADELLKIIRERPILFNQDFEIQYQEFKDTIKENLNFVEPFSINLSCSFSGNQVSPSVSEKNGEIKDQFKIDWHGEIKKEQYPYEFRFSTSSSLQLQNGKLKENMTDFKINYDFYVFPFLECYLFVQKFSDSYMSIQQRYVLGTGFLVEWEPFLTKKWKDHCDEIKRANEKLLTQVKVAESSFVNREKLKCLIENIICILDRIENDDRQKLRDFLLAHEIGRHEMAEFTDKESIIRELNGILHVLLQCRMERFAKEEIKKLIVEYLGNLKCINEVRSSCQTKVVNADNIFHDIRKKYAPIQLNLAFSVFSEIEKAEMTRLQNESESITFSFAPTQQFCWTIRPTIVLRPAEKVSCTGLFYYRFPLSKKWKVEYELFNQKNVVLTDYRKDFYIRIDYGLGEQVEWAKKITIQLIYEYHFDNAPPCLSIPDQEKLILYGANDFFAEKKHHVYSVGFQFCL